MSLKRKRSSPSTCAAFEASDASSSPPSAPSSALLPAFYHHSKPTATWSWPTYDDGSSSSQLNSRTRKRHRDDRPDEQQVFGASCWIGSVIDMSTLADVCRIAANTMRRLFEAQKLRPDAAPVISHATEAPRPMQRQRSTLHSFWHLPQGPTSTSSTPMSLDVHSSPMQPATPCEDCDGPLQHGDGMQLDEALLDKESQCQCCQRKICDTCAVLGKERICLACASFR